MNNKNECYLHIIALLNPPQKKQVQGGSYWKDIHNNCIWTINSLYMKILPTTTLDVQQMLKKKDLVLQKNLFSWPKLEVQKWPIKRRHTDVTLHSGYEPMNQVIYVLSSP